MFAVLLKRYKGMILASILFFYLGCGITLSFIRIECASPTSNAITRKSKENFDNNLDKIEYAVLIISNPLNEAKRDAIRATWANFIDNIFIENGEHLYKWNHTWTGNTIKHDLIKCFFVVGTEGLDAEKMKKIQAEHTRSNDLLLLNNFEDSYKNLAKKLINSLEWMSNNLKELKYVIKCDDDSFVRVDLIVRDLEAFAPEMSGPMISQYVTYKKSLPTYKGLYWGYFDGRARVFLNGKWQEKEWFLCDTYLPYALGGGYVISRSIVDYIAKNSQFLSHYNSEDVSMGVWTAALDGINRVHDTRFDTEWKSRGCDSNMLVRHKQTPSDMFQMYKTLVHSQGTKLCKTESALRKSYHYNWNSLPSVCCK
ncbi:beta-1,3-galactosyltransferase 6 [Vanessa cardui]|uniref:beta-1,3-galactosyltransferase 6 n=1 Tax=Vanessa cardui TaxID=171605 RepID=UPI001F137B14|nr:beta-1,3-galactosyltransferase 6 [Vanessa cardui]